MCTYHGGMASTLVITIDSSGRLVIPAAVRRDLALAGGTELAVEVEGGAIHLRPMGNAALSRRGRRLVVRAALTGPVPDHREVREERDRGTGGA